MHCNVLKQKHQIKDSTNFAQLADDDNEQTSQQEDENESHGSNSNEESLYNELMEIIQTKI